MAVGLRRKAAEGRIERVLTVVSRDNDGNQLAHFAGMLSDAAMVAKARCVAEATCSTPISCMQRWCSRRQTGLWQGRHGNSPAACITPARGFSGAQCHGLVGPKMPIVGLPKAAATCMRPESLETTACAAESARMALRRSG